MLGKVSDREHRKQAILQAARQVFASKGFEPATLEAVAREAGLAKGTLYLYFKDKEDLYFHTVLQTLESLQACVLAQAEGPAGALKKMRAIAYGQLDFFIRHRNTLQLFAAFFSPSLARLHKRLLASLMKKRDQLIRFITTLVEQGKRSGELRPDLDSRDVALAFIGMTNQAAQSLVRIGPAGPRVVAPHGSPERMADTIMRILVEGVSKR